MVKIPSNKRRSCEPISAKKRKYSKMSNFPLTSHAIEVVTKSSLSNIARQALEGIVKGQKSAQGIHKAHIEEVVRFLLHRLEWYEEVLPEGEESMREFLATHTSAKLIEIKKTSLQKIHGLHESGG